MSDAAVDVPVATEVEKPVEVAIDDKAKPETKIVSADEGIDDLKAQVERAKRESAERLAAKDREIQAAYSKANEAQREVVTVKRDQVGTIIEKLNADKDAARRDLIAAKEAGDPAKEVDALDRLTMANQRLIEAEKGKLALEHEAAQPQHGRQVEQRQVDPVEAFARTMSPRSAAWIRQHPEVIVRGANGYDISPKAMAAHWAALDEGLEPDSDAYFERLDGAVSSRRSEPRQDRQQASQGRDMSRAPTSAPVNRDVMQAPGAQRPGSIRLEPHEVQVAMETFGPLYPNESRDQILKRYAQNKMALIDEGKIARRAS